MDNQELVRIEPKSSLHPGELVCEYLDHFGWSQRELARRAGLAPKAVRAICKGEAPIKPSTAEKLASAFQRPAHLWLNLQKQYDGCRP